MKDSKDRKITLLGNNLAESEWKLVESQSKQKEIYMKYYN